MHDHSGHSHADMHEMGDFRLLAAVTINVLLTVAEVVGGILSGSLALVADALHNLSDAASLLLAYGARRIGRKPADARRTFGYRRAETIGALINLTVLVIVGIYLIYQAVVRWFSPEPIAGWIVIVVAGIALVVDVVTAVLTYAMSKGNLNVRAAFIHNVSDAAGSVAVVISGTVILLFDFHIADTVATLLVAGYVLYQGLTMMKECIRILMDSVPKDIQLEKLIQEILRIEHVLDMHHVHIRELDEHHRALEAHVVVDPANIVELETIKHVVKERLENLFHITHSTLEFELAQESEEYVCRSVAGAHCLRI